MSDERTIHVLTTARVLDDSLSDPAACLITMTRTQFGQLQGLADLVKKHGLLEVSTSKHGPDYQWLDPGGDFMPYGHATVLDDYALYVEETDKHSDSRQFSGSLTFEDLSQWFAREEQTVFVHDDLGVLLDDLEYSDVAQSALIQALKGSVTPEDEEALATVLESCGEDLDSLVQHLNQLHAGQ